MKVLRLQVIFRYSFRELMRARHPNAVIPIRLGRTTIEEQIAAKVVGFVLLYLGLIVVGGVVLSGMVLTQSQRLADQCLHWEMLGPRSERPAPQAISSCFRDLDASY